MSIQLGILFNKSSSADDRAKHVENIKALDGVNDMKPIFPEDLDDTTLSTMYMAYLKPGADADGLIVKIKGMPAIKTAYVPPRRSLF